jgi:hypothetical protein
MLKRVDDKTGFAPALDLAAWFTGKTSASGLFEDRFGRLKRSFVVDVTGHPTGSGLTLEEDFRYDDGVLERRVWRLQMEGGGRFTGTAADVVGHAEGLVDGRVARMSYTLMVPVGGRQIAMRFDDRMVLMPDNTLLACARVSKFSVAIGQVFIAFRKA